MAAHTVTLPDGRSIDFPTSMSDDQINQAVQKIVGQKKAPAATTSVPSTPAAPAVDPQAQARDQAIIHSGVGARPGAPPPQGYLPPVSNLSVGAAPEQSIAQKLKTMLGNSVWAHGMATEHSPYIGSPQDTDKLIGTPESLATPGTRTFGALRTVGDIATVGNLNTAAALAATGGVLGPILPGTTTALARLVGAKFTMDMAKGLYRMVPEYRQAVDSGDEARAKELQGSAMVQIPLTLLSAWGTFKPPLLNARDAQVEMKSNRLETAHDLLMQGADNTKAKHWDAHRQVSNRVGGLVNDIVAADYSKAGFNRQIPTADIQDTIANIQDTYGAGGKSTPKFNDAVKRVSEVPGSAYWKDLHDLKMSVRDLWNSSREGSRDESALNDLSSKIEDKLKNRASELGQSDKYDAYNKLWSTLKMYENKGVIGKLNNAETGKGFFDILNDKANGAELKRASDDLSKFGFDKNTYTDLMDNHAKLYQLVSDSRRGGIRGAFSTIRQHPIAGTVGAVVGSAAGSAIGHPMIGTMLGAAKAADIAEGLAADRQIRALGGAPSTSGRLGAAADVQPTAEPAIRPGSEPVAPATPQAAPSVDINDLVSALQNQGLKPAYAKQAAAFAMGKNPQTFAEALRLALSTRSKP